MNLIKSTLDAYAPLSDTRKFTNRSDTIGASEIGQCARKIFWLKNELDPSLRAARDPGYVDSYGARIRGTMFENHFWEPAMRKRFGPRLLYAGAEQQTFIDGFLSATPDGMIIDLTPWDQKEIGVDTDCVMAECKTADPRTNLTSPKETNAFQIQVQMGLVREQTIYRPTHSVLSYTDASFWSDVTEFVIPFDDRVFDIAKERAMIVMTATNAADLKPEGWIAGGHECRYCPYTIACGIERRNLPFAEVGPAVDPQFAAEIADEARKLKLAETSRDFFDSKVRDQQEEIKARLREKGVRKIPGVVTWSSVKGRTGYDNRAIKQAAVEAGVDIRQFETQGEPSDRLTILIGSSDDLVPGPASAEA